MQKADSRRFKAEKWHPVVRLGRYCTKFIELLRDSEPELLDQLDILSDFQGNYQGLLIYMKSARRPELVILELVVLESDRAISLDFCGVRTEFRDQQAALSMLQAILRDELLHVAHYVNNKLRESWLAGPEQAHMALSENEYVSRGCLDYLLPGRLTLISVHSWSGKRDQNSRGW
ncbi:hypothetical protein KDL44_02740 [bacterium]|nr:hypothetical protein [bacterium]